MSMTFGELVKAQIDKAELAKALESYEVEYVDINSLSYSELKVYNKWHQQQSLNWD